MTGSTDPREWVRTADPPLLFVVSGPSGTGKTTLCRRLIERVRQGEDEGGMVFSVSTTTRSPREEEEDGRDYHFVGDAEFDRMVKRGEFLEWAEVHGKRYGTARQTVEEQMQAGRDVILDIDVQGGRQVRKASFRAVLIFVLPPSFEELRRRLQGRGTESDDVIEGRIQVAREEIEALDLYDYVVVNDDLDRAVRTLEAIRRAEKCRVDRRRPPRSDSEN